MANRRREPVSYRPFRTEPLLSDGLLPVARHGGELEEAASRAFFNLAARFGERADRQAARQGAFDGEQAALVGRPEVSVEGGNAEVAAGAPAASAPRGKRFAGDVGDAINKAAAKYGVSAEALSRIAQIESGGNPRAKNPKSSAGGLFQQIDSNAKQYGVADRFDPYQSADGAARFMAENSRHLRRVLGRDPTAGELYLAHQQGPGGAAKLLANPNASAVSVVGLDAVRWNGGHPNMTAGQFAQKWIGKAEGGYAMPAAAADIDALSPPTFKTTGGRFRPKGSDTIYSRAYDEAGTRTYLQTVDAEMRNTAGQLFDQYQDNPEMLQKAFSDLKGTLASEHVFPEIQADFEVGFDRLAGGYLEQSRRDYANKQKLAAAADAELRAGELKTSVVRQVATLDPNDPRTADALANGLASLNDHYDSAAATGAMTPIAANRAKVSDQRDLATGFYLRQAGTLDADGVAKLHAEMAEDFRNGGLDGVDADGWVKLDADLIALQDQKQRATVAAAKDIVKSGEALADRAAQGYDLDPASVDAFLKTAGKVDGGESIVEDTQSRIAAAQAVRVLPLAQGQDYIDSMRDRMGSNPSDRQIANLEFAEKALAVKTRDIGKDPLGYAAKTGAIDLAPIDTTSVDATAESLATRKLQAEAVAEKYGAPTPLFRPNEVAVIKGNLSTSDPAILATTMAQVEFLANENGIGDVRDTFGEKAVDQLQDWQARLRYASKDEIAAFLKERADPKWQERIKPLVSKGEAEARKTTLDQVVTLLDDNAWWDAAAPIDPETKRLMMNDFVGLAGERYAVTGDMDSARQQAAERMKKAWGVTSVYGTRGGRLMSYPPEEYYPSVGGGKDWIGEELAAFAAAQKVEIDNLSLVSDGKTKAAADRADRPGYLVSVVDPETGLDELMTDDQGRPLRYYFDPETATQKATVTAAEERRTQHDPWLVLGKNTAIGPFYAPWRPATAADMKARQQRIDEIVADRQQRFEAKRKMRGSLQGHGKI